MTLYLCKMDPNVSGHAKFLAVIGRVVGGPEGYRFLPNTSAHKPSRKAWPTATACIPRWTERCGFLTLLEKHELPQ